MDNKKKLIWKYFLQQKAVELLIGAIGLAILIYVPYWFGRGMFLWDTGSAPEIASYYWFVGFLVITIIFTLTFLFGYIAREWLESNWKKATRRAEATLKCKKKQN